MKKVGLQTNIPVPDFPSAGPDRITWFPAATRELKTVRALISAQPSSFEVMMRMACVRGTRAKRRVVVFILR